MSDARDSTISPLMRRLSAYIAGAAHRRLPAEVAEAGRQHLLDTLAAMISGVDGTTLLRAVVLGYDIATRAELALGGEAFRASGFNMSGYGGTFGAAAAAGAIAGLDATRVRWLLSYAAQQSSGSATSSSPSGR